MKSLIALTAAVATALTLGVAQTAEKPALLIVGTPHFGNPGRDIANTRVPDVQTPERQSEIEAVVERLTSGPSGGLTRGLVWK